MKEQPRWVRLGLRLLNALGARSGGLFTYGAVELMAARGDQLRRLSRIPRAFSVRPAVPEDEPSLGSFLDDAATTAQLVSSGDVGLLALADGQVRAMEWVRLGPAEYDWDASRLGLVFRVPPAYCWLHNGSGGDGSALGPWAMILGRLPAFLEEQGVEVACLQVDCDNPYSVRCHESLGFRKVGRVVAFRFGDRRFVWLRAVGEKWARFRESELDLERLPI